jgi:hypothetical protein
MFRSFPLKVLSVLSLSVLTSSSFAQNPTPRLSEAALQARVETQIAALNRAKAARTPAQRKIDSSLLLALQQKRGLPALRAVPSLRSRVQADANNRVLVEVRGRITSAVTGRIRNVGGVVGQAQGGRLRARLPLEQLEAVAAQPEVRSIRPALPPRTRNSMAAATRLKYFGARMESLFAQEIAASVSSEAAVPRATPISTGSVVSEGVVTHQVDKAREQFNVAGAGVKIGVISDSVDFLEDSQASGDLPAVTVLPQQSGVPGTGEGTAMLEIVHDVAPQAQLFFATVGTSQEHFAKNIRALRNAGCDIIVDDIFFLDESPFEYDIVAQAIRDVTRDGALYFSAAGNAGNFNDGTSGTWEGDFKAAQTGKEGVFHNWGRGIANTFRRLDQVLVTLQWNDRLGQSNNDYDVYVVDSNGQIVGASNSDQTGTQDPFEMIEVGNPAESVMVARYRGDKRFLRLVSYNSTLTHATPGAIGDHNSIPECISIGATSVLNSYPAPFVGGARNPVEDFSSDGPRRLFFDENGAARLIAKPDMTAADAVRTSVPDFFRFYGTSAAAPHAAAIAALIKSYNLNLKSADIRKLMARTTLDIEQPGLDRDSGAGITMPLQALQSLQSEDQLRPTLTIATPAYNATVSRLERISGTVQDTASGVANVQISLQRDRDNRYWSGKNWSVSPIPLIPTLNNITYTLNQNLPNTENWLAGGYTIYVTANDRAGNRSVVSSRVRVPDTQAPILTLDLIQRDAAGSRIVRVRGILTDEPRGSGPDKVLLFLRRARDGQYWNGTAWSASPIALETTLSGTSNARVWERSSALPTEVPSAASELYYLNAIGSDVAGNRVSITKTVVLQGQRPAS